MRWGSRTSCRCGCLGLCIEIRRNNVTVPFYLLGPVEMVSYESDRLFKMAWRLRYPTISDTIEEFVK